jgi:hypothetical protein
LRLPGPELWTVELHGGYTGPEQHADAKIEAPFHSAASHCVLLVKKDQYALDRLLV